MNSWTSSYKIPKLYDFYILTKAGLYLYAFMYVKRHNNSRLHQRWKEIHVMTTFQPRF